MIFNFFPNYNIKIVALLGFLLIALASNAYTGRSIDKIAVQKHGERVYIRSWFSETEDVIICMNKGVNKQINYCFTALVPAQKPLKNVSCSSKEIFHYCHDDSTPLKIISTYIGANHGCSDARELTIPRHGLSSKDIGTPWKDSRGDIYYPIKIVSNSKIWVLGKNKGSKNIWRFNRSIKPGNFTSVNNGRSLKIEKAVLVQIIPALRIKYQKYVIDNKTPLEDGKIYICDSLAILEEYEIIAPDALLKTIISNSGNKTDFNALGIAALLNEKNIYEFQPRGVCLVDQTITPKRDFKTYQASPVMSMQLTKRGKYNSLECYIPKTKAFVNEGTKFDFNAIQDFSVPIKFSLNFKASNNNIDTQNPPDRFMEFLGQKSNDGINRKIGYAFGIINDYGLGKPEKRLRNVDEMFFIYRSHKIYPRILDMKAGVLKKDVELKSKGFRQYFKMPDSGEATCVYWHKRDNGTRLFIDYHKPVEKDLIKLPAKFAGKKIKIIEKSENIKLLTEGKIPEQGLEVSVNGKQAYLVLQLSDAKDLK